MKNYILSRPRQHRHLKRKNSILFLVFLDFPHFLSIQAGRILFSSPAVPVWVLEQNKLCCFQILLTFLIVLLRRQISICFMDPFAVIKYPYIFKYCRFRFLTGMEMLFIQPLLLKLPPEALHRRIVPAVPFAAHATDKTMVFGKPLIFLRTVLASPVGMQDTSGCILRMADCILKRGYHKPLCHTPTHRDPDHLISAKIHNPCKVQPAFICWDICNIAYHFLSGSVCRKIPVQDIFCHWKVMTGICCRFIFSVTF